ncbi:MAG: CHY zinc finger protein [Verrucomicrobiota bacterium]|nr:CHY zinc finger protein [Verrucomicrobiota bacterium]
MNAVVHGTTVIGVDVDGQTRCAHYHHEHDIIAIKFKCCGKWFPCHQCHADLAGHAAEVWSKEEFDTHAIFCGGCGYQLTVREYLDSNSVCPHCRRQFNPGCVRHYHLYFQN